MQTEEIALAKPVDYDELTLTGSQQDVDGSDLMETDIKKDKSRRYWTPKEEDRFFEIWGRENWRLTKHGKNTIYFSQWSKELKERYDVDVKPEEIQAKVNQTRAKFRQVKKTLEADNSATKWKKYDIIDKILKNQYRSDGDEPIPKEALENNRDMSPNSLSNSISLNSTQDGLTMPHNASTGMDVDAMGIDVDHNLSAGLFSDPQIKHNYSTELFTDQYSSDVKPEFEEDFQNYTGYPTEQNHYVNNATDEHQLHQLQTPQQLQQQQTIYSNPAEAVAVAPGAETALLHPQHHLQQHIEHLRQQNQPQVPTHYEPVNNATYTNLSTPNQYTNGGAYAGNYNETGGGLAVGHSDVAPVVGVEGGAMQPPRPAAAATPAAPPPPPPTTAAAPTGRKRGRPFLPANLPNAQGHTAAAASGGSSAASTTPVDGLESQYLEQVRKKNIILEEQRDISRKRLEVEERKAKLMAEFFPKMFNLQKEILSKLSSATTNTNDNP